MSGGHDFPRERDTVPTLLAAAKRVAPEVIHARERTEEMRQIPPPLADVIAKAGLYQMFLPRSVGGPEASPLVAFHAIEELSKADGSVGWCVMIATGVSLIAGWLKTEVVKDMCGQPPYLR